MERAFGEAGTFQCCLHFLGRPSQFPPPSLCGPGLFLWPAINHLLSKGCSWIPCSQPRIFLWVCNLASAGSFIPIKWKSKPVFYRNPPHPPTHLSPPTPATAIRLIKNETDVVGKMPCLLALPRTASSAPRDFHSAGQGTVELRASPLAAGSCQKSTGLHNALLGFQGQMIAAKKF